MPLVKPNQLLEGSHVAQFGGMDERHLCGKLRLVSGFTSVHR